MTTQTPATPTSPAADPRPTVRRAIEQLTPIVQGVTEADLGRPTPCTDWTVRGLLAHLVAVERRIAHIVEGGHPFDVPSQVTDVEQDAWAAAWRTSAARLAEVLEQPGVLERDVAHPLGTVPAPLALAVYAGELAAHGWDLAAALDRVDALDQDLAAACLGPIRGFLPAEPRDAMPFGPVVPVADDAPAYDRLLGWYGRDAGWRPPAR
ncbi:TIGR03086 family metal-binding protein [Nocardioides sp. T2.26MG-1]|uniref:TIGR03086 family metal-binding protein n=1 Tax=Nocardioides sp. T2.26MG-1 TaxID=3041166 RepID=UPI0024778EC5|nr:TIGR03086 family metal-binding protein [Nocardioides sp. T2.26MG-1]CAI9406451.1 putative protein [Nocardioides sp. T2.26MG-1]